MKKTFKADKIACSGCSNMIKASLEDTFGEIVVNLDVTPKEVTVEIENEEQEQVFKKEMKELGFEIIG
ncbi:heavy metal transport/detoxification protein [Malaciobacter molluscorum LMG 25693]|uniref:Heavy metal transport/detoxification protein n=1 Tax=Malaciobacter molluscorum LMG 25693 TaxID=870501 RepID=A0A2G1DFU8_9BACT|nr:MULTISPECIES: heavy metal transport/detoxification protein [Arcobacteraceae]AXX93649.1 heavy-metal-associated domain-containing protein, putative copper metallochaperone CopZ [Malaciobacter molluscorum LMG 25693]PHO17353.1 heavy metal transport/detoxification protein [Malaciobacter molluscorum LMG 25693]RXJ97770.1 heavy metal transport/detoxification protein [Arcobacter sp. CECT 8986]